jgi:hypothetical protein
MSAGRPTSDASRRSARFLVALAILISMLCAAAGAARAQIGKDAATAPLEAGKFRFNDRFTTLFGPAYADIVVKGENFLSCKPPLGRSFSYALCFYSGPVVGTPVPQDGSAAVNPPLPCTLSEDGTTANCTCYELTTDQYPPFVPYLIDINAILNLDLYLRTINVCGHDGANCSPREPIRAGTLWNQAPVCRAANDNSVIPTAELISVFSPVLSGNYATGVTPNQTACPAAKYAACMTAPCYHTGEQDSAGNDLVQCKCPVYDGPFEIGQANMPCDANALTPPPAAAQAARRQPTYVWSAAHNPKANHEPPPHGCVPDSGGDNGCPLYSPTTQYPVSAGSPLCREVCQAYRGSTLQSAIPSSPRGSQVAYTCDAALCTTLGIGQSSPPSPPPLRKAALLQNACSGIAQQSGLKAILALEQLDQCSCCASQVCGCDKAGLDIDGQTQADISELNTRQKELEITPQCEINGTLCGAR